MEIIFEQYKQRPLTDFHAELRFEFPNIPTQLFDYYLVKAAIRMAKSGNIIRRRAVLDAQHGVTRYRLQAPDGLTVHSLLGVRSAPDCGCGSRHVTRAFDPPEGACACGHDVAWLDYANKELHVLPPFCHGRYYLLMAVTPDRGACSLPEEYYNEYMDALLMGTKSGILLITGRPWTNLQLGNAYETEFLSMTSVAAIDTATQGQRGSVKMNFGRVM